MTIETSIEVARRFSAGETTAALADEYKVSPDHIRRVSRNQRDEAARSAFRDRVFHFRETVEEVQGFDQALQALGYTTRSAAFRGFLRNAQGIATVFRADLEGFARVTMAIEKPAVNINQIARKVNRGVVKLSVQDSANRADCARAAGHEYLRCRRRPACSDEAFRLHWLEDQIGGRKDNRKPL